MNRRETSNTLSARGSGSVGSCCFPSPSPSGTNLRFFILPARTRVGLVHATDQDFPQSRVVYSISTGGASLQYPNIFWIDPQIGELQLVTRADYETTPSYILRIQATNGEDSSSVTVSGAMGVFTPAQPVDLGSFWHLPRAAVVIKNLDRAHPTDVRGSDSWFPGRHTWTQLAGLGNKECIHRSKFMGGWEARQD